jgi:hypothetical protein
VAVTGYLVCKPDDEIRGLLAMQVSTTLNENHSSLASELLAFKYHVALKHVMLLGNST